MDEGGPSGCTPGRNGDAPLEGAACGLGVLLGADVPNGVAMLNGADVPNGVAMLLGAAAPNGVAGTTGDCVLVEPCAPKGE